MVIAKTLGELGFLDLITFFNAFGEPSVTSVGKIHNSLSISWVRLNCDKGHLTGMLVCFSKTRFTD